MNTFNEYLKGKKFILYTDHKPLEKMGHLHTKTMNRLQSALLEHNFVIQYKRGQLCWLTTFPNCHPQTKTYWPRLLSVLILSNLSLLIYKKPIQTCKKMNHFWTKGEWPPHVTKANGNYLQNLSVKLFQDANKIVWIQLDD